MTDNQKKALMVYGLGAIVVILVVGAAIAHIVETKNANPLGLAAPAPSASVKH